MDAEMSLELRAVMERMARELEGSPVMAWDPERKNNADLIYDAWFLGYVEGEVLDATYGEGKFWDRLPWRPVHTNDLNPDKGFHHYDARELPAEWEDGFDTVVFDPPYKLNGRPDAVTDARYGVDVAATVGERIDLVMGGALECQRVTRKWLLVKVQDQVNGGRVRWMGRDLAIHLDVCVGAKLVDELYLGSYRPQPSGRGQQHARRNYSTLQVYRKKGS